MARAGLSQWDQPDHTHLPGTTGPEQAHRGGQARLSEVARGGTLNLIGAFIAAVATLGGTVIVTRQFSKATAGAFFTATSAFLIVEAIGGLGANTGLVYFVARLRSLGEGRRIPVMLRAAVIPVVVVSVAALAAMALFAGPLAHVLQSSHLSRGSLSRGTMTGVLRALALALPFAALLDTFLGASRGYGDMRPTVAIERMGVPVVQLLAVLMATLAGSAALLAPLWALPYVPAAGASWLWLRHIRRGPVARQISLPDIPPELAALMALATPQAGDQGRLANSRRQPDNAPRMPSRLARRHLANANVAGFWRFTAPRAAANLTSIIIQRLDIVLIAIMRGPTEAAVYTAATRFLVAGQFGNMAISRAAQPRLTELFTMGDRIGTNTVYQVTTAWLILLLWPIYLLVIVYGQQVLAVFGRSYNAGDTVMVILAAAMLLGTALGQVDVVLITSGRSSWSLANGLLVLATNVTLDLLLIPRYGITGAAIAWAIAITVSNAVPLVQLAAVFRLHPAGRGTVAACALSAVSFGIVPLAARALLGTSGIAIATAIFIGGAVYAVGSWRFRGILSLPAIPALTSLRMRRRPVS